jgi:hypothetical protein
MKLRLAWIAFLAGMYVQVANAQDQWTRLDDGQLLLRKFDAAPFPHRSRKDGFSTQSTTYPADPHYTDATIGIFIPAQFKPGPVTDFVVHFHGHINHVDNVVRQFDLPRQMRTSGVNAMLIIPQGPRDAADSGGGKVEEPGGFERMIDQVAGFLKESGKIPTTRVGRITLSAHSGGYRAASFVLRVGGLRDHITDVLLFDASYGQLDGFADFCKLGGGRRLISLFTEHLADENVELMAMLQKRGVAFSVAMEADLKPAMLAGRAALFIHTTDLGHNDVVSKREYFSLLLWHGYAKAP